MNFNFANGLSFMLFSMSVFFAILGLTGFFSSFSKGNKLSAVFFALLTLASIFMVGGLL